MAAGYGNGGLAVIDPMTRQVADLGPPDIWRSSKWRAVASEEFVKCRAGGSAGPVLSRVPGPVLRFLRLGMESPLNRPPPSGPGLMTPTVREHPR